MKTSQWSVALAVLVVLVFGITFFVNYIGDPAGTADLPKTPPGMETQLAFPIRGLPVADGKSAYTIERGAEGQADFWFHNANDKPIPVGLNRLACKCSSVEVWIVQEGALRGRVAEAVGLKAEAAHPDAALAALARLAATAGPDRTAGLESAAEAQPIKDTPVEVPPGAVGWVRMKWKNNLLGPQKLDATLWFHHPQLGPTLVLEAWVHFHEPFALSMNKVQMPDLQADRLPDGGAVVAYSFTRPWLDLRARNVPLGRRNPNDGFAVEKPEALTRAEIASLESQIAGRGGDVPPIRSAYRIRYAVNPRTSDGKGLFDQGVFTRRIEVGLADEGEKQTVLVEGSVRGDIRLEGPRELGAIDLSTFEAGHGSRVETRTLTTPAGLELEIDRARTAPFLKAELETPKSTVDGGRSWVLNVKVEPKKVVGRFPRLDDPDYQDTAVYVRPVGGEGRALRIPAHGNATQ